MSREIWLISDTHFGHENILKYENRPFKDIDEMDEKMVENWNSVVKQGDKVYHLGDVWMGSGERAYKTLSRLNGKKRLVLGNHDDVKSAPIMKWFQKVYLFRSFKEFGLTLSHVPMHPGSIKWVDDGGINVHGHIHSKTVQMGGTLFNHDDDRYRCVSVEHINYTPINIDEVRVR